MLTVVTGAAGHLGANMVRALLADGRRVRAVVRDDRRAMEGLPVEVVRADVLDPESLSRAFDGATTVFHLAARISLMGDPDGRVASTNVTGPRNVVAACRACGVGRLIHFSSIHALHDDGSGPPLDEDAPPADAPGLPAYDRSKAAGQREVLAAAGNGLDAVIVQPSGVIGPHDFKPSRMGRVLLALARGRMPGLVAGGFSWVDARDVAAAAIAAESRGRAGAAYLVSGPWRSVTDVARIAAGWAGVRPPRLVVPLPIARALAPFAEIWGRASGREPLFTRESLRPLDTHRHVRWTRAEADLDHRPRPVEETIVDTLEWFRSRREV